MSETSDRDGRGAGEFSEEEGRIHQAGFRIIHDGMKKGLSFDDACAGLQVVDPELRRVIVDDYLKVTIAERHFQGKEPLEEVAADLKLPLERVETARAEMLHEVQKAAAEVYKKQAGEAGFDMGEVGGEEEGKH